MKKFFVLLLIFMVAFTMQVKADSIRAGALAGDTAGADRPTALLNDTSILGTYPGALQLFPSAVWLTVTSAGSDPTFGVAYIANDLVGIATKYASSTDPFNITAPTGWSLGITTPINADKHVWIMYGLKFANLAAGIMIQNSFPSSPIISQSIDTNGNISSSEENSGFKSMIKPSAVLNLGTLKIYGSLYATLNLLKYEKFANYETNIITISPNSLQNLGIDVTGAMDLKKDKWTVAARLYFNMSDDGYSVTSTTNTVSQYSSTNYIDKSTTIGLVLGTMIKPNEKLTLFFDIPFSINIADSAHWEGDSVYNTSTTWTLPVLKAGAEVNLGSGFTFRASAAPEWKRTISTPNKNGTKSITDSYTINSALGLGFHTGRFYINSMVSGTLFSSGTLTPLSLVDGLFTDADNTIAPFFTRVQINYVF